MFAAKQLTEKEIITLLNCQRLSGRLTSAEAAAVLGFGEGDITTLMAAKLLKPLGKPAPNAPKFFASVTVSALAQDERWLNLATIAVTKHWLNKNSRKRANHQHSENGLSEKEGVAV